MPFPSVTQSRSAPFVARRVAFDDIRRADWDRLLAATASPTPFSRWTFHRAWWDAYGATAHEEYLLLADRAAGETRAIVPLMHRHEVEADDASTHTVVREHAPRCAPVDGQAMAIMFGASYHADYATALAAPEDLGAAAVTLAHALADESQLFDGDALWDVVDLRRLRGMDPSLPALDAAMRAVGEDHGWRTNCEEEDVCPVVTVRGDTWDEYLATLEKSDRHEIRRKMRRAATVGSLAIEIVPPSPEVIEDFISLHDQRFGEDGLFPDNEGGRRSRLFVQRLAELEQAEGPSCQLHVARVTCGAALIFTLLAFDDGQTCFMYNGGMDPEARQASPGVTGVGMYFQDRIAAGRRRFDFLRGNERYKYEWGAVDEPIFRLLVQRGSAATGS
ncbi:MAG TPA: GNAT family N-acetyltransferase [Candidatus Limnocylindrales bacterium]|nr:GNAT family N-acetyltransferase [Candidatus Limnocylindrales bacterium]